MNSDSPVWPRSSPQIAHHSTQIWLTSMSTSTIFADMLISANILTIMHIIEAYYIHYVFFKQLQYCCNFGGYRWGYVWWSRYCKTKTRDGVGDCGGQICNGILGSALLKL